MQATENLTQPTTGATKKSAPPVKNKKRTVAVSPALLEDSSEQQVVKGWRKLKQDFEKDLLLFKITPEITVKMEWTTLPDSLQTAFMEVLNTLKNKGEQYDSEIEGECFVFGFTDESVTISAVCTALNGKVAFFYKEEG